MKNQKYENITNNTLTPENSEERGFEYSGDVFIDYGAPIEAMESIFDELDSGDYLLGKTASIILENDPGWFGLYYKIDSTK